jgi:8-amino-7-oxononanoate synthase
MRGELQERLANLQRDYLRRDQLVLGTPHGPLIDSGRRIINLASNDYLGLTSHPVIAEAAARAAQECGSGAGAARLVSGTLDLHVRLEERISRLLCTEQTLLFGSGYLAHLGIIPALAGEKDIIYSDERNHASIVDGCRLSHTTVRVYRHGDAEHLASLLEEDASHNGRRLIITETVFSMDGDEAPLEIVCKLAGQYDAWVVVDEAHAFGIRGPSGAGLVAEKGLGERVHVRMGTLGKAIGSYGAFVAGCTELAEYLMNSARTYIFSTALPPPAVAGSLAALDIVTGQEGDQLRRRLNQNMEALRRGVTSQGWQLRGATGPIFPLHVGDPQVAVDLARRLLDNGLFVRAMRYPTVAVGSERLRVIASASLTPEQVEQALSAFSEVVPEVVA